MASFAVIKREMTFYNALVISVCVADAVTIAYDGSVMGSLNVMPSYTSYFNLNHATTAVNSCATSIGAILVGPLVPMFTDGYGRKVGIYAAYIINIIGAIIAGAAQNIAMFIAGRMIIGVAFAFAQTAASAYVAETTTAGIRAFALGLYYSCWAIGGILAASISYGISDSISILQDKCRLVRKTSALDPSTWAWRIPTLFQGVFPIIAMGILYFVPESPRWLAYQDRPEKALRVLCMIGGRDETDPSIQLQYREIIDTIQFEKTGGRSLGLRECVRTPSNRKRFTLAVTMALLTMLTGSNIITYVPIVSSSAVSWAFRVGVDC